jgi:hypothetical protein
MMGCGLCRSSWMPGCLMRGLHVCWQALNTLGCGYGGMQAGVICTLYTFPYQPYCHRTLIQGPLRALLAAGPDALSASGSTGQPRPVPVFPEGYAALLHYKHCIPAYWEYGSPQQ